MLLRIIVWPIWLLFLVSMVFYIPGTKTALELSPANIDSGGWFFMIAIAISIIAIIEGLLTVTIRHFALIRPAERGTFIINTLSGGIRFLFVNIFNWFIAETIAVCGMALYIMSERIEFLYIFGLAGLSLIIFHAPRFSPYQRSIK